MKEREREKGRKEGRKEGNMPILFSMMMSFEEIG
jgi:hypothetical protein